jgi:hypothetical protein
MTSMTPIRAFRRLLNSRALTQLSDHARFLYTLLVFKYRGRDGIAYPSISTLTDDCNWGERKTRDALADLRAAGFIVQQRHGGGRGFASGTVYYVKLPDWASEAEREIREHNCGATCAGDTVTDRAVTPALSSETPAHPDVNSGAFEQNSGAQGVNKQREQLNTREATAEKDACAEKQNSEASAWLKDFWNDATGEMRVLTLLDEIPGLDDSFRRQVAKRTPARTLERILPFMLKPGEPIISAGGWLRDNLRKAGVAV